MNEPVRISDKPERLRWRAADFESLAENDAFADHGKAELIDGDIYLMPSQMARHARAKARLSAALTNCLIEIGSELEALVEVSVRVADDSVPEPDVIVTSYRGDRFVPSETVMLVIEVAHTTHDVDMGRKLALYASAAIPEYWVVDVAADRVLIHTDPHDGGYRERQEVPFGAPLNVVTIPGLDLGPIALTR